MDLKQALQVDHPIIQDIRRKSEQYGPLTPRQEALVLRLAREAREAKAAAPTGRHTFTGEIQSAKWKFTDYGSSLKITVRVETPGGVWRAWGTCPASIVDAVHDEGELVGRTVQLTARLQPSDRDEAFAFYKRPAGELLDDLQQTGS